MPTRTPCAPRSVAMRLIAIASLPLSAPLAHGQSRSASADPSQQTVVVSATTIDTQSAMTQAPTLTPLDVTQPTSVISQYFIQNNMPLSSNYADIVAIAPSVQSVSPNGSGLMENQILSIRGFTDGYYNVTFDGIPWNDANDFTHHSTSYFMDNDLGSVAVDRGPGTAATIGNATFGGTISNLSKVPLPQTTITPYVSVGSFNTQVFGAEFDTGRMDRLGGGAGFIDAESLSSDGELTDMGLNRKNIFTKFEFPVAGNTVITLVAMYNQLHQDVGLGATAAQIAQYGPTYGLTSDPTSQDYFGYNFDEIHTDFEYIGLTSNLGGGWTVDNKTYTYGYWHRGHNGLDPNGPTPNGTGYSPTDVPGQLLTNDYRSWGDTLHFQGDYGFGDIQTGLWFDRQINFRALAQTDETLGDALDPGGIGNPLIDAFLGNRLLDQTLTALQPFVQLDWKPLPGLTLSPGVRYDHFERAVDADVNVKTGNPQSYTNDFASTLPSFLAHYRLHG